MTDADPSLTRLFDTERNQRRQNARPSAYTLGEFYGQCLGAPGLRGLWYPGSIDNTGALYDRSGQGRTLTMNGNPTLGLHNDLVPYIDYDGTGDYHSRADEAGLDITGTETTIAAALRGLTVGGWFWLDTVPNPGDLMAKWNDSGVNQRSYTLHMDGSNVGFFISSTGTNFQSVSLPITAGGWHFVVGRFLAGVSRSIFVDGEWATATASIFASLFVSTAAFTIMRYETGPVHTDGRCAKALLAAAAWPDKLIRYYWERSRVLFGI